MAGLISTVAEVRQHIKIQADFSADALPKFTRATSEYLLPIIGEDLYTTLETAYNGGSGTPSTEEAALIDKCRAVIIPFAFLNEMVLRHLNISESGIMADSKEDSRTAFRWEYNELKEQLELDGFAAMELLIVYLKANAATFTDWADSPYNDAGQFAIIRDGAELRGVSGLLQPHRCYMMLRGIFNTLADSYVKPNISAAYYTALNNKLLAGTATTEHEDYILPLLRKACVRKALAIAAMEMGIRFSSAGFTVASKTTEQPDSERASASAALLKQFMVQQEELARNLFEQAITYMNANASETVFAEYYASDVYTAPGSNNFIDQTRTGIFTMS